MAWDFTADSDIQRSMAQKINEKADSLDGEFAKLYGQIGTLGTHWVGDDYDLFSSGCDGYKTALGDLSTSMRMYAGHFEKIATGTDELATTLIAIVQNMTTRYGGGGPGGPGGTGVPGGPGGTGVPGGPGGTGVPGGPGGTGVPGGPGGTGVPGGPGGTGGPGDQTDPSHQVVAPSGDGNTAEENQGFWSRLGQRYVDDWNDLKSDFNASWEGTDGLLSGAWSCVETVLDGGAFVVSGAVDTVQGATDIVQGGWNWIFDMGDDRSVNGSYWQNVGSDFAENWDYSSCDSVGEYVGTFFCDSVIGTVGDTAQLIGNAGVDAVNGVLEAGEWIVEGATDILGTIGNWILD